MVIVRRNTNIPIPKIFTWNDDAENSVGSEYIIMSHAEGIELRHLWFELDSTVQISCIRNITEKIAEMTRLEFSAFGSLYSRDSAVREEGKVVVDGEFCIGSSCSKTYWDCAVGESRWYGSGAPDRGPCKLCHMDDGNPFLTVGRERSSFFRGRPYQCRTIENPTI
jgi:hypothetical protein